MVARNNTYNFNNIGYYHLFYIYFNIIMEDKVEIGWKKEKKKLLGHPHSLHTCYKYK